MIVGSWQYIRDKLSVNQGWSSLAIVKPVKNTLPLSKAERRI
jgi:hypothetical protein